MGSWLATRLRGNTAALVGGFAARGLSVVLGFAVSYYVGNQFGAVGSGQYALLTQSGMLLSLLILAGTDFSIVKLCAAVEPGTRMISRASLARLFGSVVAVNSLLMLMLVLLPTDWTLGLIGLTPGLAEFAILGMIMLTRSLTRLTAAFLRSQGENIVSQIVELLFIPALVLIAIAAVPLTSVTQVLQITVAAGLLAALLGLGRAFMHSRSGPGTLGFGIGELVHMGIPVWGLGVALNFADWYSLATVSIHSGVDDAGIFRIAMQIGTILLFGVSGLLAVFSAQVARANHNADHARIGRLCRNAAMLNLLLVAPAALILFFVAPQILAFVGPEFVAGTATLRILLGGQLAYAVLAPAGQALAMMGHARINLMIVLVTTAIFLVAAPLMAQRLGAEGVALAMVAFLLSRNLLSFYWLLRATGINGLTGQLRV
ncbi:MAG: hypothetical protein HC788_05210 [Sphingopyxis sp.]|nr:hypothetical protein [Sphingopyxis sp.]